MSLPALDMSLFSGTPTQKSQFSNDLLTTLKTRGVAKIKNHGIPESTISELFSLTRQFFALSHEEKMFAEHPPESNPNRGYSYVGQENISTISGYGKTSASGKILRDIKETLDLGSKDDTLAPNRWIKDTSLPAFRPFMESFYDTAFNLELQLLTALALALEIPPTSLINLHMAAQNEFRLLHYPATPASSLRSGDATRIAEHTDFGTITLLFQDSTGGLQVEDQESPGTFHDVSSASQNEIIINIGDSLQRLTNDTFRAACHRVTYPPTVKAADVNTDIAATNAEDINDDTEIVPERFSVAYFAKVDREGSLKPFSEFVSDKRPCRYDDITAGEFNNLRIARLYGKA